MHLFIHIQKTGGMSIRHGLRGQILNLDHAGAMRSPDYAARLQSAMLVAGEHHGFAHVRWRDVKPSLRKYPAFAFVRNPWSRVASRYFFARQTIELGNKRAKIYANITSFDAFLEERHEFGGREFYWHRAIRGWHDQLGHVVDEQGRVRCAILRTEHLNEDLKLYMDKELPPRRRNVTFNTIPYREFYNDRQIQIVADWHKKDIEFFGFTFLGPATRNLWSGLC